MRKQILGTIIAATASVMLIATGCSKSNVTDTTTATTEQSDSNTATTEATTEAAKPSTPGSKFVAADESFQLPLPGDNWILENENEDSSQVTLTSDDGIITISRLTGDAAAAVVFPSSAEEFAIHAKDIHALTSYDVISYKNNTDDATMTSFIGTAKSIEDADETKAAIFCDNGYTNASTGEYVVYELFSALKTDDQETIDSVEKALSNFLPLNMGIIVASLGETADVTPDEADSFTPDALFENLLFDQYSPQDGSYSMYLPSWEWTPDESKANEVVLSDANSNTIIITHLDDEAVADAVIPEGLSQWEAPEEDSATVEFDIRTIGDHKAYKYGTKLADGTYSSEYILGSGNDFYRIIVSLDQVDFAIQNEVSRMVDTFTIN